MKCPKHIENFVEKLPKVNKFFECDFDEYHIPYLIKCSCGSEVFKVLTNDMPSLVAKCYECGNSIIVYDLKFYPAATIIPGKEEFKEYISPEGDHSFNLSVIYEYSSDDPGIDFNPNDITWCEVYGYGVKSGSIFKLLNDETA